MDDFLWDTYVVEGMFSYAFKEYELWVDAHIVDTFSEIIKSPSSTPLFGHG